MRMSAAGVTTVDNPFPPDPPRRTFTKQEKKLVARLATSRPSDAPAGHSYRPVAATFYRHSAVFESDLRRCESQAVKLLDSTHQGGLMEDISKYNDCCSATSRRYFVSKK